MIPKRVWLVLGAVALLATACGGGGGGGGTPTAPMSSTRFNAESGGGNAIVMSDGGSGSPTVFRLEIRASGVNDLYGAAFDVVYPTNVLNFTGTAAEGTFLGSGSTTFNVVENPNGNIIVGVSRLGGGGGVDGSGTLLTLDFTITASGEGDFRFVNRAGFGPNGQGKPNLEWRAGSITTVR